MIVSAERLQVAVQAGFVQDDDMVQTFSANGTDDPLDVGTLPWRTWRRCVEQLQAVAVNSSDITDLMKAVSPFVRVLRYGTARRLPEDALRSLILSISVEINAGVRMGSRGLDEETAAAHIAAVEAYDEALRVFADDALTSRGRTSWARSLMTKSRRASPD